MGSKEMAYGERYFESIYMSRSSEDYTERFKRHIRFILNFKRKGRILDMGFAKGEFLGELDRLGWSTYGIDVSKYALKEAQKNTKAVLKIVDLNRQKVPFSDNYFDVIYASEIIEHLKPSNKLLSEIHRCLKKGGFFFLTTPNRPGLKQVDWDKTCGHINLFDRKKLAHELQRAGFESFSVKYEGLPGLGIIRKLTHNKLFNDEVLLPLSWPFSTKKSLIAYGFK